MSERLVFGYGASPTTEGHGGDPRARVHVPADFFMDTRPAAAPDAVAVTPIKSVRERRDWAFIGLMTFTAMLFFRPQDQVPALAPLHLAEISALVALAAMVAGRIGRGQGVSRFTPELVGVVLIGGIILLTAPFSIWMGGAIRTFTDIYVKVILIFLLMVNTLNSPKRVDQFLWLIVVATAYIASRAVADYARGINLIEYGRVQGSVGGMFKNPNDLALNMVAGIPLAAGLALRATGLFRRSFLVGCAMLMAGAVVASQSRSGSVGLVVMMFMLAAYLLRRRPGLVFAGALALVLALPLTPASYWSRISSITDASRDDTGSREARQVLLRESYAAFLAHPLTGVGAGQFKNYDPEHRVEAWRESHNVLLQVAAEIGVVGLVAFVFLIVRAATAGLQTRRLLRRARGGQPGSRGRLSGGVPPSGSPVLVTEAETEWLQGHAAAMAVALAGWFICALFASVAYNWTFYYLLALAIAPREILVDRLAATRSARARVFRVGGAAHEARA